MMEQTHGINSVRYLGGKIDYLIPFVYLVLSLLFNIYWESAFRAMRISVDPSILFFSELFLIVFGCYAIVKVALSIRNSQHFYSRMANWFLMAGSCASLIYSGLWLLIFAFTLFLQLSGYKD